MLLKTKGSKSMKTLGNYLMASAVSGYFKENDWQSWAMEKIIKENEVEGWIYEVSEADTLDQLKECLNEKLKEEDYYKNNQNQYSDGVIGYYYLSYLKNRISLDDLLYLSTVEAKSGDTLVPYEKFQELLKEFEEHITSSNIDKFLKKIDNFYYEFKEVAEKQIEYLSC